jgi:hypothetical protein
MIRLVDLLSTQGIALGRYKIHLATPGRTSPLQAYWEGTFKEWQEEQNGKNFECETVIGLIHRGDDRWLYAGGYRILSVAKGVNTPFQYTTELLPGQDDLVGRIIVRFQRPGRNSYIWGHKFGSALEVAEILASAFAVEEFQGYNKVLLSHSQLKVIVRRCEPSWQSALSSISGVYLIMDTETGKTYVGSAYGKGGIWLRWRCYAENGHGNNAELKALLDTKGAAYTEYFQYSILEIADPLTTKDQVWERENHWKDVLMSRKFGYNSN